MFLTIQRALIATLKQLHLLDSLNKQIEQDPRFEAVVAMSKKNKVPVIDIGIGLNTGVAVAGEMGSSQRSDYTVIGDPINLGARLESLCKYYNSKCNISNFTKAKLTGKYIYRFLDLVTVKGKSEPIEIWQVIDFDVDEAEHKLYSVSREQLDKELELHHKAVNLYKNSKFTEALEIFKDLNLWENKTNKNIYDIYIQRCEHYIQEPPKDFNGVFVHKTKG
jgi:adenylate cyclase